MAIFTQIWPKWSFLAIFGHKLFGQKYGHVGYPWKYHKQTNSPVKKSSCFNVWKKSYGQKTNFSYFEKNLDFSKYQKWSKNPLFSHKIKILRPLLFLQLLKLKKQKWSQNCDFLTKNVDFCHFLKILIFPYFCTKMKLRPLLNMNFHQKQNLFHNY